MADVDVPLGPEDLRDHFVGREAYRRTEYIVARHGGEVAVLRVRKASNGPLFSPITDVEVLAGPDESVEVLAPQIDTGVPSQLARAAADMAPGARCVVVCGRYEHVNFILEPSPIPLRIVEVVPPEPAKLVDQVARVLDLVEDLPPVDVRAEAIDRAPWRSACRRTTTCSRVAGPSGSAQGGRLPRSPSPARGLGPRRMRTIAPDPRAFLRGRAPDRRDCPRELVGTVDGPTLTKCCLLEDRGRARGLARRRPVGSEPRRGP